MRKAFSYASRLIHMSSHLTAILSALCVALLMVAICVDVGSRLLFNESIQGVVEYGEFLMVALVYLGLGYSQLKEQHVAVDLFVNRLPDRLALLCEIVGQVLACGIIAWMVYASTKLAIHSVNLGESRFGLVEVPVWPDRIVIAAGLAILLLELLVTLMSRLKKYRHLDSTVRDS